MSNDIFNDDVSKNWLRSVLRESDVQIEFVKKDGTNRIMQCTLQETKIPSEKIPKTDEKTYKTDTLTVFDVEKQDWRSFRWDSIRKIDFTITGNEKNA